MIKQRKDAFAAAGRDGIMRKDTVSPLQLFLILVFLTVSGGFLDREVGTASLAVGFLLSSLCFFLGRTAGEGTVGKIAALSAFGFLIFRIGEAAELFSSFWVRSVTPTGSALLFALPLLLAGTMLAGTGYRGIGRLAELLFPLLFLTLFFSLAPFFGKPAFAGSGTGISLPSSFHTLTDLPAVFLLAGRTVSKRSEKASAYARADAENAEAVYGGRLFSVRDPVLAAGVLGLAAGNLLVFFMGTGCLRAVGTALYGRLTAPGLYAVRVSLGESAEPTYLLCLFAAVLFRIALLVRAAGELLSDCTPSAERFSLSLSALLGGGMLLLLSRYGVRVDRFFAGMILLTESLLSFLLFFSKKAKKRFDKKGEKRYNE